MTEESKPKSTDEPTPGSKAAPHNPGLDPKPDHSADDGKPSEGAPYDKKPDPAQQPS